MPIPDAQTFADAWVRAWNAHDGVLFSSPVAARVVPDAHSQPDDPSVVRVLRLEA